MGGRVVNYRMNNPESRSQLMELVAQTLEKNVEEPVVKEIEQIIQEKNTSIEIKKTEVVQPAVVKEEVKKKPEEEVKKKQEEDDYDLDFE